VNAIAKFNNIYFATDTGLFTDNSTFYSKELHTTLVNVTGDLTSSGALVVNDIASNNAHFVIGMSNGQYYDYTTGFGSPVVATGLETIHKVVLVGDDIWLFGFDKMKMVSTGAIISLATGNRLTWQQ